MRRTLTSTLSLEERGLLTESEQALASLTRSELRALALELEASSSRTEAQEEQLRAAERALARLS